MATKKLKEPAAPSKKNEPELVEVARELIAAADLLPSWKGQHGDRFVAALERLRALVPELPAPKRAKAAAPLTPADWDARVLAWSLEVTTSITLDRALTALAPETPIGSEEHNAIAAALNRLPRDRFDISWYLANATLAPKWTKR